MSLRLILHGRFHHATNSNRNLAPDLRAGPVIYAFSECLNAQTVDKLKASIPTWLETMGSNQDECEIEQGTRLTARQ